MLNVKCYSVPQFFGLPYQRIMIDEDDKNVSVFAIETQSEEESTCDRSVLQTKMDICSYFLCLILPLLNVYRNANDCASRVMELYDS